MSMFLALAGALFCSCTPVMYFCSRGSARGAVYARLDRSICEELFCLLQRFVFVIIWNFFVEFIRFIGRSEGAYTSTIEKMFTVLE